MIVGMNAALNQYTPTFLVTNIAQSQILIYDSTRRAFINVDPVVATSDIQKLGQLIDVSPTVDDPLSVQDGQALVYNSFTQLWTNSFVDFNTLINKPSTNGTVTNVSVVTANGISGVVANPTSTPTISLTLGAITPTSVHAVGTVLGSNLSGTNTGDQTITLTGAVAGSGTGTIVTTLAPSGVTAGTYGNNLDIPIVVVNASGVINSISTVELDPTISDLIPLNETITILPRRQYIVTSRLEVLGNIVNNGRIAIL